MAGDRQIRLASFLTPGDVHIAGWRVEGNAYSEGSDFEMYLAGARAAEDAKFDLVLLGDIPARSTDPASILSLFSKYDVLDPQTVVAALSVLTKDLGIAATASTTYEQPYHIARRFATMDHLSKGRVGWNVVTTANPTEAYNFGLKNHPDPAERYERAEEFVDVTFGLWDSWKAGGFSRNKRTGTYFDADAFKALDHHGKHFDVRGPLDIARSPQERPIIIQAGSSGAGQRLAARAADIVFTSHQSLSGAQKFYRGVKDQVAELGRNPDEVSILCGVMPFVGRTRDEAKSTFERYQGKIVPELARAKLSELLGDIDLSAYAWEQPLPHDLPESKQTGITSRREGILGYGKRKNLTMGQLATWVAGTRGHISLVGTGSDVADMMEEWFVARGSDGFLIFPYWLPEGIRDFGDMVVPELQKRALFKSEYAPGTLRQKLFG